MRILRGVMGLVLVMLLLSPDAVLFARDQFHSGHRGPVRQTDARPIRNLNVHNVSTYWSVVSNFGSYGDPDANFPSGEWPGGSDVYYIYDGRFWVGALVGGEPLVTIAEGSNTEWDPSDNSIFYFGSGPKSIQDSWVRYDDQTSYSGHVPIGIEVSQRGLTWSLSDFDDFHIFLLEVKNISGNTLNDVFISWVFDNDVAAGPNGDPTDAHIDDMVDYDGYADGETNPFRYDWVDPLDIDGDGWDGYDYWGWPAADPKNPYVQDNAYYDSHYDEVPSWEAEPDGIYDEFQIYLVEDGPVIYGQPGTIYDGSPIVTAAGDTLKGYLISRNMSYMMDGDFAQSSENDTGERTSNYPNTGFIGTRIIYMPQAPFMTAADDTLTRPYSHQWWNWNSDPGSDREKYEYMTGTHSLSDGMHFMPHPFDYGAGAPVFDYRYMISTGPYNGWQDQEVKKFVKATGVGLGLKGLRENMDNAFIAYWTGDPDVIGDPAHPPSDAAQEGFVGVTPARIMEDQHFNLPIPPPIPDLQYSASDRSVNLLWDNSAETTLDNVLGRIDFEGYKIYRAMYAPSGWELIAAYDNVDGYVFLTNTEGDTVNPIRDLTSNDIYTYSDTEHAVYRADAELGVDYEWVMIDLPPGNSNEMVHRHTDAGGDFADINDQVIFDNIPQPVNGLNYYYTVCAYDPNKPDINLTSIESARSNYRRNVDGAPEPVIPRTVSEPENNLDNIRVVPNPYRGTAEYEARYENRLSFIHLPARCKISIFTLTGDLVDEIYHNDVANGAEYWDLVSRNDQQVVSGLYIYVVETPDGESKIDRFLIIR